MSDCRDVCGACMRTVGSTVDCPSCEPIARLAREYNGKCYSYMMFGGEKPEGYDQWLRRRKKARR